MGKRGRKTRWRTLTITGENSDSEESNTTLEQARYPRSYNPKHQYFNKYTYSSQSTPTRRYQHDSSKSTRSSSTASDNKITFNEDEYTRITTPRQDVLFKKGYLSKPKTYQTQTSTGTSTYSTGNSTGNGTPDHQSTDLEYESQFVFPNGFVDQNGVYFINGYEPYPLMVFNPPTYYEYSNSKTKRGSTSSPAESGSPHNEETTSQDLSQSNGENVNNISELNYMYNVVYPGFYGVCPPQTLANGQYQESRRIKKRTRRKLSKTVLSNEDTTPEYTDEEYQSSDEVLSDVQQETPLANPKSIDQKPTEVETKNNAQDLLLKSLIKEDEEPSVTVSVEESNKAINNVEDVQTNGCDSDNCQPQQPVSEETVNCDTSINNTNNNSQESSRNDEQKQLKDKEGDVKVPKYDLKPDAEEFIPRNYQPIENAAIDGNLHFIKLPHPNFMPIAMVNHLGEFPHHPQFVPLNFISHDPKMYPNFVNFVPNDFHRTYEPIQHKENCPATSINITPKTENIADGVAQSNDKQINMTHIVSKLEQISKEQESSEEKQRNTAPECKKENSEPINENPQPVLNGTVETVIELRPCVDKQNTEKKTEVTPQTVQLSTSEVKNNDSTIIPNKSTIILPKESKPVEIVTIPSVITDNPKAAQKETANVIDVRNQRKYYFKQDNRQRRKFRNFARNGDETHASYKHNQSSPARNVAEYQQNIPKSSDNEKIYSEKVKSTAVKSYNTIKNNYEQKVLKHSHSTPEISVNSVQNKEKNTPVTRNNQSQWISVGRKKRRNKNVEVDDFNITESSMEDGEKDLYESYDVNLLQDVIPTTPNEKESNVVELEVEKIELEVTEAKKEETKNVLPNATITEDTAVINSNSETEVSAEPKILEVAEIEKELINQIISTQQDVIKDEHKTKDPECVKSSNTTKKSKKNVTKPLTKRIIITDTYDTVEVSEVKNIIPSKEIKQTSIEQKEPKVAPESNIEKTITEAKVETPSKTSKKKKKKSKQVLTSSSVSSSNTTINVVDSYDLLLETSLINESEDRTNVEISQELDKMIQKGMYSNLEEKIKMITPNKNDGFFKTIMSNISFGEPSVTKSTSIKTPDFSKLLRNAALKPSFTVGGDKIIDLSPQNLSLPNSNTDIFLENPQVNQILEDVSKTTGETNTKQETSKKCTCTKNQTTTVPKNGVKNTVDEVNCGNFKATNETQLLGVSDNKHPITEAVKTWMIKTRENTPELELLKSPSTIYKEFCDRLSDSDESEDSSVKESQDIKKSKHTKFEINNDNDEEVTVFTMGESFESNGPDLLDCWENEIPVEPSNAESNNCDTKITNGANCANGCVKHNKNDKIYDGDDVIDIYESKYGQNEDFMKCKTEITERRQHRNFPKHGDLPYRAICCNIM